MNGDEGESKVRFLRGWLAGKQTNACCVVLQLLHRIVKESTITARWSVVWISISVRQWVKRRNTLLCTAPHCSALHRTALHRTEWLYAAKWKTHVAPPRTISSYPVLSYHAVCHHLFTSLHYWYHPIMSLSCSTYTALYSTVQYSAVRWRGIALASVSLVYA